MADEWNDNVGQPTDTSSFAEEGRSLSKGRGFKPMNNNNDSYGVGSKNGNYKDESSGFGTDNNDEWDSGGKTGGTGNNDEWNNGGSGGNDEWGGGGGGGWQSSANGERGRGGRGGRGGGRGGRGGSRFRDDDGEGGGGNFNRRFEDADDDSRPRRGGRGGGRGGGGFRKTEDGGGGGGFNDGDEEGGSSFRGRGGRGGRGGGRGRNDRDGEGFGNGGGEEDPDKPPPVTYIPPEPSTDESEIFSGVNVGINFSKYDSIPVKVSGENVPEAIEDFSAMGLRTIVYDNLVKSGYTKPTPVQKHAIPIIKGGRDLMACAQTGSGKTAAFLVPIINTLLEQPTELKLIGGGCAPHCVVISPTRELASQIWQQALKFSKDSLIKCVVAYGGVSTMHQGRQVANGCHILVATPGRLNDFVERRRVSFESLRFLVLDEADRMLDMGFLDDIRKVVDHETMVPKGERQTLMFSATFAENVQRIASDFLNEYLFLTIGIVGGACSDVEQSFHEVPKFEKRGKLQELLKCYDMSDFPRTLIFVEMKKTADFLAAFLSENNYPTTSMHGDRTQEQREEALRDFKCGKMPILVATAVAARGLDIKGVAHVINYDMPKEVDEYVHRIGRTGRVGNRGKATSFFDPEIDGPLVNDLVKVLSQAGQDVPDWLSSGGGSFAPSRGEKFGGRDVRKFGNGTYDEPSNQPNMVVAPEEEEEW